MIRLRAWLAACAILLAGSAAGPGSAPGPASASRPGSTPGPGSAPAPGSTSGPGSTPASGSAPGAGSAPGTGSAPGAGSASGPGSASGQVSGAGAAKDPAAEWFTVPVGWRSLAELVPEHPDLPGNNQVRVESRAAYGDPSSGCYSLVQRVSVPSRGFDQGRAMAALIEELERAGWKAGPVGEQGELPFAGKEIQGRVRAKADPSAGDRTVVLSVACFYNDREPDRCRATCDAILESAGVRR